MSKYIDVDKLIAEIENIYSEAVCEYNSHKSRYSEGALDVIHRVSSIIASLQQEQPEMDLEKEMDKFYGMYRDKTGETYAVKDNEPCFDWKEDELSENDMRIARHFYELGLNTRKDE